MSSSHVILRWRCLHVFCVPALLVTTRKNAYNNTTHQPPTTFYLSRYVYSIIFVFLRLCSSHQLLYTLTKHVNLKATTNNICSQVRHTYIRNKGYVRIHLFRSMLQVNLYLYIRYILVHIQYTYSSVVQVVRACNPSGACVI